MYQEFISFYAVPTSEIRKMESVYLMEYIYVLCTICFWQAV